MQSSSINQNISVILAYRAPGRHTIDVYVDLKRWFNEITIVGPDNPEISKQIKNLGGIWVEDKSCDIQDLWEKGIQSKNSPWYLLLEGREYISTVLKESIVKIINSNVNQPRWFPIKREIFFLKQRLKYPMEWSHDPKPGLLFGGNRKLNKIDFLKNNDEKPLEGKSIYFAENNLEEIILNSMPRAERGAKDLYRINPGLNLFQLIAKIIKVAPVNFYKKWILCRGIREQFEGLVFSLLDTITIILGYIVYHEKYIRSGEKIEDNLYCVKKILIIKLRGLGDAVLGTPVLKNIKKLMPDVSISVVTFNFSKPIFENNPYVDELFGISGHGESSELNHLIKILNSKKYDLIINLHSRNFSSQLAKKIKSRWRISASYITREKHTDVLINSAYEVDKTSIERDLDCLRVLGLVPVDKEPELFITEEENKWAKKN